MEYKTAARHGHVSPHTPDILCYRNQGEQSVIKYTEEGSKVRYIDKTFFTCSRSCRWVVLREVAVGLK